MSWLGMMLTLVSIYLIGLKKPIGHLIGLVGSLIWIWVMWGIDTSIIILNFICICLYIKNWIQWTLEAEGSFSWQKPSRVRRPWHYGF